MALHSGHNPIFSMNCCFAVFHSFDKVSAESSLLTKPKKCPQHLENVFVPWIFPFAVIIGHFRVLLCHCFKTSLSAKPFMLKSVPQAVSLSCKYKSFS